MEYKMAAVLLNKQARGSYQFPKILTFIFKICFICEYIWIWENFKNSNGWEKCTKVNKNHDLVLIF